MKIDLTCKVKKDLYVVFILLSLIYGCSEQSQSYFPLDKNKSWYYNGRLVSSADDEKIRRVVSIAKDREIQGADTKVQRTLVGNEHYYREDDRGIHRIGYMQKGKEQPVLYETERYLFRYPLEQNKTWDDTLNTISLRSGGPRGITVNEQIPVTASLVSLNDSVEVPAGTFKNCLRVEKQGEIIITEGRYQYLPNALIKIKEVSWYAAGVGLVKLDREETSDHVVLGNGRWELELARLEVR